MNVEPVHLENRQFKGREIFDVAKDDQAICPVCEQTDRSKFFMRKDGYDLHECRECQHVFVWPIPTIEELKYVYSFANSYQVQRKLLYDENTVVGAKTRDGLKQIENFCTHRGRLLDVGCSSGKLLWLAKQSGWVSVRGVELNKDTAQIANDNGLNVFVGELAGSGYPPASFDAIHLGDVIEHVQDPTELLHQAAALLKSDGVMVLVTPNHDAIFPLLTLWLYRIFRTPWSHAAPPFHLNQFTERSLTKLLRKLNLTAIDKQYRRCNLRYELGETHVLRSFRHALRERRFMLAMRRLVFAAFTAVGYAVVYGIDRCCIWKKRDFEMLLVIRKANC